MEEYKKHSNFFNEFYDRIKPIIDDIRKIGYCGNCGGTYVASSCQYCATVNDELENLLAVLELEINELINHLNELSWPTIPINKVFNLFHSLKNVEIPSIKNLLSKYDYVKLYKMYVEELLRRISDFNAELSQLDISVLETMIFRNENDKLDYVYQFLIRNAILKRQNVSYECFKVLIEQFVELLMKNYYLKPKCLIKNFTDLNPEDRCDESITSGTSSYDVIELLEEDVENLYRDGKLYIFRTIFHELTHTMQSKQVFSTDGHVFNDYAVKELKDYLLATNLNGYKKENYAYLSYEHEANYMGIQLYIQYLETLGLTINKELYSEKLSKLEMKMANNKRYVNGEETTLDELFAQFIINRPDLLASHSQLQQLYKLENGCVIPITDLAL